jgi:hypothetical protein
VALPRGTLNGMGGTHVNREHGEIAALELTEALLALHQRSCHVPRHRPLARADYAMAVSRSLLTACAPPALRHAPVRNGTRRADELRLECHRR